jgi:hypothetical protein
MRLVLNGVFIVLCSLFLFGCAGIAGDTLKIDPQGVAPNRHMPEALETILGDLGYRWVPIPDPLTHRDIKTVQQHGEWIMRFRDVETGKVQIDARIRRKDGFTWLKFHETGGGALSPPAQDRLQKAQDRLRIDFGEAYVSY